MWDKTFMHGFDGYVECEKTDEGMEGELPSIHWELGRQMRA